jgi:FAD/FMN-containing dehydrogenase
MIANRRRFVQSLAAAAAATRAARLWADAADSPASLAAVTGAGKSVTLSASDIKDLRAGFRGQVLLAQDAGYDKARRLWNSMFDRRPALIARCAATEDVVRAVTFARAHDLLTAVRGGGHSLSGQSACDGGLMIDMSPMRDVEIDTQRRFGRAHGGVLLGELDRKMQAVGLATTLGTATDTGIAGLTLGGGMGRLMRKHGLACDNLQSVELVSAQGKVLHASASENQDLFWGVRGGGGNFGVVTRFEYRLHPLQEKVMDGARIYPYAQARSLLAIVGELSERCPDDLLLAAQLLNFPPGEERPGRVALVGLTYFGSPSELDRLLAPLGKLGSPLMDLLATKSYLEAQGAQDVAAPVAVPSATRGAPLYTKTGFLHNSSTEFNDEMVRRFEALPAELDAVVLVAQMGGAVSRVSQDATAFWTRQATHDLMLGGSWADRSKDAAYIKQLREVWSGVERFTEGFYVNTEPGADDTRVRATYGGNYARLQKIKTHYDPGNLFRMNANIKPTAA